MKVLHIVSSLSRLAGGPARSVQGLVAALECAGVETHLLAIKPYGLPWVEGVKHFHLIGREIWFGVRGDIENVIDEIRPDLIHIHSIWQIMLHLAVLAAKSRGIPYVLAPRGTIEKWSLRQKWWKKKLALMTYQGHDLRDAAAIHVTAQSEADQVRALGYDNPIIFSPNGVNVPDELPPRRNQQDGWRRALFMSRINYKKGLLNLVEAWAGLRPAGWKMEIVGTDEEGYQRIVEARVRELHLENDFIFTGPLTDECKWEAYRRADIFVLPTFSENFGIVIAEALYAGLPVITTKGAPWQSLEDRGCGWWVDIGVPPLVEALRNAMNLSDAEREVMGRRARELVDEQFSWPELGRRMKDDYEEILSKIRRR